MNKMNEMFEALVRLKTECHTALFSDDVDAVRRDELHYEKALASQHYWSDEQITAESVKRWNEMISKMNEEYKKRNENK
jgi:hypothetical protein